MPTIRPETASDREAVSRVERAAFESDDESRLVDMLRDAGNVILSLVAEEAGEVIGHALFSPLTIEGESANYDAVALGPIAVLPECQGQGVGGALILAGFEALRGMGHRAVVLTGHTTYYPRFGFRPGREFDLHYQDDRDAFMAVELVPGALEGVSGRVKFAPEFAEFE